MGGFLHLSAIYLKFHYQSVSPFFLYKKIQTAFLILIFNPFFRRRFKMRNLIDKVANFSDSSLWNPKDENFNIN